MDERVSAFVDDEISVGDYVLSGGETAAMVLMDSVSRSFPEFLERTVISKGSPFMPVCWNTPSIRGPESLKAWKCPKCFWKDITEDQAMAKKTGAGRTLARRPTF